jgi:PmbA protein
VIEEALDLASSKTDGAEVVFVQRRSTSADYEDDKLKRVDVAQTSQLRVRVIVGGKIGTAHTTDTAQAKAVVARAIELAEFGSDAHFAFPGPSDRTDVKTYDPAVEQTPKEELVAAGGEMVDLVKAYNGEIKVFAGAGWAVEDWRLANSSGLDVADRSSSFGIGVGGVLVRNTDMLFVYLNRDWRRRETEPRTLADRAIQQFRLAERTAPLTSKTMPVILSPRGSYVLLLSLLIGVNGKNVLKGDSPLAGRLGDKVAADCFTLVDDGTIDYAPASGPWDGEGVPRRRTPIIEHGILRSFIYDLETAGKAGAHTTGNGPGCEASNVVIPPGDRSLEDMIRDTKEGLLVEHVLGLGQSNIMNGDFSVNISLGYKIENGEIVGRVKNAMLAGNVYDALPRVAALGSEPEWAHSSYVPPILIDGLSVIAKD